MNPYVILFRQTAALSEADRQHRAQATAPWARRLNEAGHQLQPYILGADCELRGPDAARGDAISALLFLQARDLAEAARIAESHPAVEYGAQVEIRPWAPPAPVA